MLTACSAVSPSAYGGHLYPGNNLKLCNALSSSFLPSPPLPNHVLPALLLSSHRRYCVFVVLAAQGISAGIQVDSKGCLWILRETAGREDMPRIFPSYFPVVRSLWPSFHFWSLFARRLSHLAFSNGNNLRDMYFSWIHGGATIVLCAKTREGQGFFLCFNLQVPSWDHRRIFSFFINLSCILCHLPRKINNNMKWNKKFQSWTM